MTDDRERICARCRTVLSEHVRPYMWGHETTWQHGAIAASYCPDPPAVIIADERTEVVRYCDVCGDSPTHRMPVDTFEAPPYDARNKLNMVEDWCLCKGCADLFERRAVGALVMTAVRKHPEWRRREIESALGMLYRSVLRNKKGPPVPM